MAFSELNKNGKRKRDCIDTYNDLNEGQLIIKDEDDSDKESGQWVRKNSFMVQVVLQQIAVYWNTEKRNLIQVAK